jgi:putative ABC transport system substrate-binding protein
MTSRRSGTSRGQLRPQWAAVLLAVASLIAATQWAGQVWAQADVRRVGVLSYSAAADNPGFKAVLDVFRRELASLGWIEGKNMVLEYRDAGGDPRRFPVAAEALAGLDVDVIFATSAPALRAAHAATRTIPIVGGDFTSDPVAEGYIRSYVRPGGNVTGVFLDAPEFAGKWFELLREIIPGLSRVAVLWDPGPGTAHLQAVRSVAGRLGITLQILEASRPDDLDRAFIALDRRSQAIILLPSPMVYGQSARLASLALQHALPATSMAREFAIAGGTLAYGPERASVWKRCASLVARILDGAAPADVTAQRASRIELVVNLKTARALGIAIPQSILLRAEEVIR